MRKTKAFLWKRIQCQLRLHAMRDFHKPIILFRFREVIELASLAISIFQEKRSSALGNPLAFLVGQMVKNPPANSGEAGGTGLILGLGRSPGEGIATHSSILAWRIPWTEEPGGLQSTGSPKNWMRLATDTASPQHKPPGQAACSLEALWPRAMGKKVKDR